MPPEEQTISAIELTIGDLGLSALLILAAGIVSIALRLRFEGRLLLASVRTVVQLVLIGYILSWVFDREMLWEVGLLVAVMILVAARTAVTRCARTLKGAMGDAFITLSLCGLITSVIVTSLIVGAEPWYKPQYLIPLLGMILGNSLTGISLALDSLLEAVSLRRDEIELRLSLGATRWEAANDALAEAVRRGMIPIINSMMVVGIVALPGMMTGQILQGADPHQAVRYQIMVMFMIGGATSCGCFLLVLLTYRRLFTSRHQLKSNAVRKRGG